MSAEDLPLQWHGQQAVITLPEEIDVSNGTAIYDRLLAALGRQPAVLIVDMTPTTYCDSSGVRAVMLAYREAVSGGCELRLAVSAPGVLRVFSILGADQLFGIHPSVGSALGHPGPRD